MAEEKTVLIKCVLCGFSASHAALCDRNPAKAQSFDAGIAYEKERAETARLYGTEPPKGALRIVPPGATLHTCGPNAPEDCEGVLSHATMIELESVHVPVIRAAFSRGRHIGHRDTREKYEKMLEIMDERVNLWRTRAKTALGESKHETHLEGCGCGGFDRTASHSAGEYVGYCAQKTTQQPKDAADCSGSRPPENDSVVENAACAAAEKHIKQSERDDPGYAHEYRCHVRGFFDGVEWERAVRAAGANVDD